MPELPEVETTMRALRSKLTGQLIVSVIQRRPDLRFPLPEALPERLEGQRIQGFSRRAKYIQVHLDGGETMLLHLGMSGRLLFGGEDGRPHEHLTFQFQDGTVLRFIDPRRFGMLDLANTEALGSHKWMVRLGYEPLDAAFDGRSLARCLKGKLSAIKTAIMDQRVVVGVGNIYASESLFRAAISPKSMAGALGSRRLSRLANAIKHVLQDAIEAGGSSLRDYVQSNGELGNFQSYFQVYDREDRPCVVCSQPIRRIVQTGRATFFCANCQR